MHFNFEDNDAYLYRKHIFQMLKKQTVKIADKLGFWKSVRINATLPRFRVHSFIFSCWPGRPTTISSSGLFILFIF